MGLAAVLCAAEPAQQPQGGMRVTTVIRSNPRTGKLVRSVVVTPKSNPAERPIEVPVAPPPVSEESTPAPTVFDAAVERVAAEHSIPASLIHSVIQVESNYDPGAVSSKGAQGLMQLIPETARRFGVSDAFDPLENMQGGARYLRHLLDLYRGDFALTLAAYNAGEGAVARYGGIPPYPETQQYVQRVSRRLQKTQAKKGPRAPQAQNETKLADAAPAGPRHIAEIVEPDGSVRYVTQ